MLRGFTAALGGIILRKAGKMKVDSNITLFFMGIMGSIFMPIIVVPTEIISKDEFEMPVNGVIYVLLSGFTFIIG